MRVLSIPIKAEKWQTDIICRRMNLIGSLWNRMADEYDTAYRRMCRDIEYQVAHNTIMECYSLQLEAREERKNTPAYKSAVKAQSDLFGKYGFTSYSFKNRAAEIAGEYKHVIPSRVAAYTIGNPLWILYHEFLTNRRNGIKRIAKNTQRILRSDGRSGIRLLDESGKAQRNGVSTTGRLYIIYGKSTGKRVLKMPLKINSKDTYVAKYMACPMRWIGIVRDSGGGEVKLIAHIMVDDDCCSS